MRCQKIKRELGKHLPFPGMPAIWWMPIQTRSDLPALIRVLVATPSPRKASNRLLVELVVVLAGVLWLRQQRSPTQVVMSEPMSV